MTIKNLQDNTPGLRLVGKESSGSVSTIFGPVKAGLTTTHKTQDQALSELLKCLEREVENLNIKYCEAYVTLMDVMEHLARLTAITKGLDTIRDN